MKKNLIAYFSRKGHNYVSGGIGNLSVGNTEVIARKIQSMAASRSLVPTLQFSRDWPSGGAALRMRIVTLKAGSKNPQNNRRCPNDL